MFQISVMELYAPFSAPDGRSTLSLARLWEFVGGKGCLPREGQRLAAAIALADCM